MTEPAWTGEEWGATDDGAAWSGYPAEEHGVHHYDPHAQHHDAAAEAARWAAWEAETQRAAWDAAAPIRLTPAELSTSIVESTKLAAQQNMTKNYGTLSSEWRRSFQHSCSGITATMADLRDPRTATLPICIFCRTNPCTTAFFPCQHVCVCDDCIDGHKFTDESTARRMLGAKAAAAAAGGGPPGEPLPAFTMCPSCMTSIKRLIPWSPDAAAKYWAWVDGPIPRLDGDFCESWRQNAQIKRRADGKMIAPPPLRLDKEGKPLPPRPAPSPFQHSSHDELGEGCCVIV